MNFHTVSGAALSLDSLRAEQIDIEDIARGLANMARFNGQTRKGLPVAQHLVVASYLAPSGLKLPALMHDAHEYITGDVTRPVKEWLKGALTPLENQIDRVICEAFGLDVEMFVPTLVEPLRGIDNWLCEFERAALFSNGIDSKFPMAFKIWSPKKARRKFLNRFHELTDGKWREDANQ